MARSTTDLYNKVTKITDLIHELSNDIEEHDGIKDADYNLEYVADKIDYARRVLVSVHGQIKYKIKDGK